MSDAGKIHLSKGGKQGQKNIELLLVMQLLDGKAQWWSKVAVTPNDASFSVTGTGTSLVGTWSVLTPDSSSSISRSHPCSELSWQAALKDRPSGQSLSASIWFPSLDLPVLSMVQGLKETLSQHLLWEASTLSAVEPRGTGEGAGNWQNTALNFTFYLHKLKLNWSVLCFKGCTIFPVLKWPDSTTFFICIPTPHIFMSTWLLAVMVLVRRWTCSCSRVAPSPQVKGTGEKAQVWVETR